MTLSLPLQIRFLKINFPTVLYSFTASAGISFLSFFVRNEIFGTNPNQLWIPNPNPKIFRIRQLGVAPVNFYIVCYVYSSLIVKSSH
jgi:hypothetical protein